MIFPAACSKVVFPFASPRQCQGVRTGPASAVSARDAATRSRFRKLTPNAFGLARAQARVTIQLGTRPAARHCCGRDAAGRARARAYCTFASGAIMRGRHQTAGMLLPGEIAGLIGFAWARWYCLALMRAWSSC